MEATKLNTSEFIVTEETAGQRLDLFLSTMQNKISRNNVRRAMDDGLVSLNGQVEHRHHYKVKTSDVIVFTMPKVQEDNIHIEPEDIPLDIVYEDNDLLIVNKPAGMVIHPATGNYHGTLMNGILFHYKDLAQVGSEIRSGLIHRIDKDTSGLVLVGKTNKGLWHYSKMFADRKVHKTYLAIVAGNISERMQYGHLDVRNYLGRKSSDRKKFASVPPSKGRIAETEFNLVKVVKINGRDYSVITASPKTGRTHQIRVHLLGLGYPIMGDVIYGRRNQYKRLMLHAWKLEVELLSGKNAEFEAPIPEEFLKFYKPN